MLARFRVPETKASHDGIDDQNSRNEHRRLDHFPHKESECHASQAPPDVSQMRSVAAAQEQTLTSSRLLLLPPEIILNLIPMLPYPEYVHFGIPSSPSGMVF